MVEGETGCGVRVERGLVVVWVPCLRHRGKYRFSWRLSNAGIASYCAHRGVMMSSL